MPVLDRPEIKKEDLGVLANTFLDELSSFAIGQKALAHYYIVRGELCIEAPNCDYGLVDAPKDELKKYSDNDKYATVYDSTGPNGTHRIAVYEKQPKYVKFPVQNTPALEQAS